MISDKFYKAELANKPNVKGTKDLTPFTTLMKKADKQKSSFKASELVPYTRKYPQT